MFALKEDRWINDQAAAHSLAELEDCAIAVDASYYLRNYPEQEPLLSALGGLAGIQRWIEADLDRWEEHRMVPFFVFDGQSVTGQDELASARARQANQHTDRAWDLYASSQPEAAVTTFGQNMGAFRVQELFPLLQRILKQRNLHFLVPPFNASAQIAYFDMIDSDQCAGIMGFQELLLYPIRDSVIRTIDWNSNTVTAISKKNVIKQLNISEALFVDVFLMTGTSFLPAFPPLMDSNIIKAQPGSIWDAMNLLRTADKSVTQACNSFGDILNKAYEPNWLDKYRKAHMVVNHFIYIAEDGEVKVNDPDRLTSDNHEYLGYQLPSELFHYVNTGLIGPRVLSWITHGQHWVLPTLDGYVSEEYKKLMSLQLVPVKQSALGLMIPRLHRGLSHKDIKMKVWYDLVFSETIWEGRAPKADYVNKANSWVVKESAIKEHFPNFQHGSILAEVSALKNFRFASSTLGVQRERVKGLESLDLIVSTCLWRFLHLRGYVNDSHQLTVWGKALGEALAALEPTVKQNPDVPHLFEAVLMAFELLRYDLLNTKNKHQALGGLPIRGSEEDQASLLLISRCATLLQLRHEAIGYTGPLSKSLLTYRSLVKEVRDADRDLTEAIVASMFLYAQAKRRRDDSWELSQRLPFLFNPDVAMGIAVKTWLDEAKPNISPAKREEELKNFPDTYVPHALDLARDMSIAYALFDAIHAGVKTLGTDEMSKADKAVWDTAAKFLEARR